MANSATIGIAHGNDYSGGVGPVQASTIPGYIQTSASSPANVSGNGQQVLGEPFAYWIAFFILILLAKWLSEHGDSPLKPVTNIKVGGYNLLLITITAIVGISLLKIVFNKWPVPGLTTLVNAT